MVLQLLNRQLDDDYSQFLTAPSQPISTQDSDFLTAPPTTPRRNLPGLRVLPTADHQSQDLFDDWPTDDDEASQVTTFSVPLAYTQTPTPPATYSAQPTDEDEDSPVLQQPQSTHTPTPPATYSDDDEDDDEEDSPVIQRPEVPQPQTRASATAARPGRRLPTEATRQRHGRQAKERHQPPRMPGQRPTPDEEQDEQADGAEPEVAPRSPRSPELWEKVQGWFEAGCCKRDCFRRQLNQVTVYDHVTELRRLTKRDKKMYLMGVLDACTYIRNQQRDTTYRALNTRVCQQAFLKIHELDAKTLNDLRRHLHTKGVCPKEHGNLRRAPKHKLMVSTLENVKTFLQNWVDDFGRWEPRARRQDDGQVTQYFAPGTKKRDIFTHYEEACRQDSKEPVAFSTFKEVWLEQMPHIRIMSPKSDVCEKCELLTEAYTKIPPGHPDDRRQVLQELDQHVAYAKEEHDDYKRRVNESRKELTDNNYNPDFPYRKMAYTFDFAQTVSLPHRARQPGPIYFLSLRKVHLFGFSVDAYRQQFNYLFDEADCIGLDGKESHAPNTVISLMHDALEKQVACHNDEVAHFNADNCASQNKNNAMLWYLAWRVMHTRHRELTLNFQVVGHTKCQIDGGFGHIKTEYHRRDVQKMEDLVDCVNAHAYNKPVTEGWAWYRWNDHFRQFFREFRGVTRYNHFRFSSDSPGWVFYRDRLEDQEQSFNLVKRGVSAHRVPAALPTPVPSAGLSTYRAEFLYEVVRSHVVPDYQDILCPRPDGYQTPVKGKKYHKTAKGQITHLPPKTKTTTTGSRKTTQPTTQHHQADSCGQPSTSTGRYHLRRPTYFRPTAKQADDSDDSD